MLDQLEPVVAGVNAVASLRVWGGVIVLLALGLLVSGRPRAAAFLSLGLTIEIGTLFAKLLITLPWILSHATASDGAYIAAEPDDMHWFVERYTETSPEARFAVTFPAPGTYVVRLRMRATRWDGNQIHIGLDGVPYAEGVGVDADGWWRWVDQTPDGAPVRLVVARSGAHIVNVWVREDGVQLDRLIVASDSDRLADSQRDNQFAFAVEAERAQEMIPRDGIAWVARVAGARVSSARVATRVLTADVPSAHLARVVVGLGLLLVLLVPPVIGWRRWLAIAAVIAVTGGFAVARVAEGAHTPGGTMAGIAFGLAWFGFLTAAVHLAARERRPRRSSSRAQGAET